MMHPNCYKSVLLDKHLYNNSALSVKFPTKDVTLPKLTDSSEGLLVKKSSQDITHKKRAQLKRFNHTKPPAPSVSPCDDRVTDTCSDESSSLSWLKRTGSSNSGSSTAESSTTIGSPTDLRAQGEFKTRTILRPRWKLGKSRSVNSLSQDSEPGTMVGMQTPMDLNDSNESKSEVALRQKWKFGKSRSVHPSSQYPKPEIMGGFLSVKNVSDSSKSILNSSLLKKLKISSRASVSKDIRKENAAKLMYDPEKPTDSFCNETEQTERGSFPKPPKTKVESFSPDASNRNVNVSLNIPLPKMDRISQNEAAASTSLVVKEKSEKRVSAKAAVELRQRTEVPFHSLCKNTSAAPIQRSDELENYGVSSYNALLRPVAPKKSGELKQHIAVTTAMAWLTSGLAIVTGGLPMGRAVVVVGLVYYWHLVSICRKIRKASKKS
ncbi:hypothetical protein KP509_27G047000 [Ceratopteris richardii]|nr:hypothetical protein KP509_27G047000 [Ceratopteris richardii]